MTDINTWKLSRDSVAIAQILSFVTAIEQAKVTSKALDGTVYIQTIGTGTKYADVTILSTLEEKDAVNQAEADGAVVTVVYRDKRYAGYIEAAPEWDAQIPGEWYKGTLKILIEEVA
jgi:hypothetical protein